ncbi:MAG: hypothetical protein ACRCXN_13030 [Bacteroidales bacterium]
MKNPLIFFALLLSGCAPQMFVQNFAQTTARTIDPNAVIGDSTRIEVALSKKDLDRRLGKTLQKQFGKNGKVMFSWERVGVNQDSVKIFFFYLNPINR